MATLLKSQPRIQQPKLVARKIKAVGRTPSLNRSASAAQAKANLSSLLKSVEKDRAEITAQKIKAVGRTPSLSRSASVAQAKANLSSLLKSVEKDRTEITLMRRGVPVAKIVPLTETKLLSGYGWMRGSVHELGDIVGPTGEEWTLSDE